jgi:hypothetical protein
LGRARARKAWGSAGARIAVERMNVGDRGWIVYGEEVLHVEYLGESTEPGLPDYPYKASKFFRLLEDAPSVSANLYVGRIHESCESAHHETILHTTRKAALEEAVRRLEQLDQQEREYQGKYGDRAAKIRAQIALLPE